MYNFFRSSPLPSHFFASTPEKFSVIEMMMFLISDSLRSLALYVIDAILYSEIYDILFCYKFSVILLYCSTYQLHFSRYLVHSYSIWLLHREMLLGIFMESSVNPVSWNRTTGRTQVGGDLTSLRIVKGNIPETSRVTHSWNCLQCLYFSCRFLS